MKLLENRTKEELIEKLSIAKEPIVIYGAGVSGQVLLLACKGAGIQVE